MRLPGSTSFMSKAASHRQQHAGMFLTPFQFGPNVAVSSLLPLDVNVRLAAQETAN